MPLTPLEFVSTMDTGKGLIRPYSFLLIQVNRIADSLWILASLYVIAVMDSGWSNDTFYVALLAVLIFAFTAQLNQLYRSWRVAPLYEELYVIWHSCEHLQDIDAWSSF